MKRRREPLTWPRSPEEEERVRWETEWLVELLDAATGPPIDPALVPDERVRRAQEHHLEWLARELWLRQSRRDRLRTAAQARRIVARTLSTVAAKRLRVRTEQRVPERVPIPARIANRAEMAALSATGRALLVPVGVAAGTGRELAEAECDECVTLPRRISAGDYVAIPVVGDSMTPAIHAGDTVLVKVGATPVRGTVIVARHPDDGYVVKQVGAIRADHIELLSLNPAFAPLHIPRDPALIVGTVVLRWCAHDALTLQ